MANTITAEQYAAEQVVVDQVRMNVTLPPHLAGPEAAGIMMMARWAYRAGLSWDEENTGLLPKDAIEAKLPKMKIPGHATEQTYEVYKRTFDRVVKLPGYENVVLTAFSKGVIDKVEAESK